MRRKVRFLFLLLLGILVFAPFFVVSIALQVWMGSISFYGVLFTLSFLIPFITYCYFLYCYVRRRHKVRYPYVPPEGRMDIYFPRTDIPRPIHEDVRRYPRFFGRKKKKRYERRGNVKRES